MKLRKIFLPLLFLAFGLAGESAWAHGSRAWVGVGVYVGPPVVWGSVWGPWYPPPYYYPPAPAPVIVVPPATPPVYVEQAPAAPVEAAPETPRYWYYCPSGKAYYPYVKECPEGWQRVLPQPEK